MKLHSLWIVHTSSLWRRILEEVVDISGYHHDISRVNTGPRNGVDLRDR
jgi:hypothetical protein